MSGATNLLLVVDMQAGLDHPQYGERCNPDCEINIQRLLKVWREAKQPVLYTQHVSTRPGSPLAEGGSGTSIKEELSPIKGEHVFTKSTNSAFKNRRLLEAVKGIMPANLVVAGMTTDACVTATAREAKDLGYDTVVVGDACATFSRPAISGSPHPATTVHELSLASLAASGIQVLTAREAIELAVVRPAP